LFKNQRVNLTTEEDNNKLEIENIQDCEPESLIVLDELNYKKKNLFFFKFIYFNLNEKTNDK